MTSLQTSRPSPPPLMDQRILAFLVFAVGMALAVFLVLLASNVGYARAKYTIWPCVALGGWAVALMIRFGGTAGLDRTAWRTWWAWGLVAYVVHLWWGFGVIFGWSVDAVYAGQGSLVAGANFTLLGLWAVSVAVSFLRWPMDWLHFIAALLFAVSTLTASILFGRDISPIGGVLILAVWLAALYMRNPKSKKR